MVILLCGLLLEKRQVLILFGRGLPVSGSLEVGKWQVVVLLGGWLPVVEKWQVLILFGRGLPVSGSPGVGKQQALGMRLSVVGKRQAMV